MRPVPVHHVVGNHCLAARRQELLQVLGMPASYYSVALGDGWKLIVLDITEMSLHSGYPQDSEQMQQAHAWLAAHPSSQYQNAETWNGGLTSQQLMWLEQELDKAAQQQQQVIVACHHPLAPGSAPDQYMAWGNNLIVQRLEQHIGLVRLVLSGHYHPGGYTERSGVHYVVCEGILEAPADSNAYAVVELWQDSIRVKGFGVGTSRVLLLERYAVAKKHREIKAGRGAITCPCMCAAATVYGVRINHRYLITTLDKKSRYSSAVSATVIVHRISSVTRSAVHLY